MTLLFWVDGGERGDFNVHNMNFVLFCLPFLPATKSQDLRIAIFLFLLYWFIFFQNLVYFGVFYRFVNIVKN